MLIHYPAAASRAGLLIGESEIKQHVEDEAGVNTAVHDEENVDVATLHESDLWGGAGAGMVAVAARSWLDSVG
jgi:hypothetical protein